VQTYCIQQKYDKWLATISDFEAALNEIKEYVIYFWVLVVNKLQLQFFVKNLKSKILFIYLFNFFSLFSTTTKTNEILKNHIVWKAKMFNKFYHFFALITFSTLKIIKNFGEERRKRIHSYIIGIVLKPHFKIFITRKFKEMFFRKWQIIKQTKKFTK